MGKRRAIVPAFGDRGAETVIGSFQPRWRDDNMREGKRRLDVLRWRCGTRRKFLNISPAGYSSFYHSIWAKA